MTAEVTKTPIAGVFELVVQSFSDQRGAFLNVFRSKESAFVDVWGNRSILQVNLSRTELVGSIRGLHYQSDPYHEAKLVRCIRGKVWDVAVDLRMDSSTYGQWHAVELSPQLSNAILIPEGFAHGFQVLESNSELLYLHSGSWEPKAETGVRWNDPRLEICWPLPLTQISDRDRSLPCLSQE